MATQPTWLCSTRVMKRKGLKLKYEISIKTDTIIIHKRTGAYVLTEKEISPLSKIVYFSSSHNLSFFYSYCALPLFFRLLHLFHPFTPHFLFSFFFSLFSFSLTFSPFSLPQLIFFAINDIG